MVWPLCVGGATRRNNGKSVFVLGAKKTELRFLQRKIFVKMFVSW